MKKVNGLSMSIKKNCSGLAVSEKNLKAYALVSSGTKFYKPEKETY